MILYLRRARKICQLTIFDVKRMTGFDIDKISQCERTNECIDMHVESNLWNLYLNNEKPSRSPGKLQTVEELKAAYYEAVTG